MYLPSSSIAKLTQVGIFGSKIYLPFGNTDANLIKVIATFFHKVIECALMRQIRAKGAPSVFHRLMIKASFTLTAASELTAMENLVLAFVFIQKMGYSIFLAYDALAIHGKQEKRGF
jgi:hypothetical protein